MGPDHFIEPDGDRRPIPGTEPVKLRKGGPDGDKYSYYSWSEVEQVTDSEVEQDEEASDGSKIVREVLP